MTAAALTPSKEYIENGVTLAYAVPFRFRAVTHIKAQRISAAGVVTELAYGTDYSVTGGETDAGGTLTVNVAGSAGTRLRIRRETPRSQDMDYTTGDNFPAESHEAALDKVILIDQEQDQKIDDTAERALLVPDGEFAAVLPAAASRLGKFLAFDANANPIAASGTGADIGLRVDLAAADGSANVGVNNGLLNGQNLSLEDLARISVPIRTFWTAIDADDTASFNRAIAYANSLGGVDRSNCVGVNILLNRKRYTISASLNPILVSGVSFVGEGEGTVILHSANGATFQWGSTSGSDTVIGGGLSRVKHEYLAAPGAAAAIVKICGANGQVFSDWHIHNIGIGLVLGHSASRTAAGVFARNWRGSVANGDWPLFDLRYGAGFFFSDMSVFVSGVSNPVLTSFTATFATDVMTVTSAPAQALAVGQYVHATGVSGGTTILSLGTGTGGTGTYNLSTSPGTLGSRTVYATGAMTTTAGRNVFECVTGSWDTCQGVNCLFERFDVGLSVVAGSGMTYQNFDFGNVKMDYFRRYCIYAETASGGVCSGIRTDSNCWFVSWETNSIEINASAGYNDEHKICGTVPISGVSALYYNVTAANNKNNSFDLDVGATNRIGTSSGCLRFAANAIGFTLTARGGGDYSPQGLPFQSDWGVVLGADCDKYAITGARLKGVAGFLNFFAANAAGSPDRLIKSNGFANYVAQQAGGNFVLPTSGVPWTNREGFDVEVNIGGGTVSGISKAGVATGMTSGSFIIAPGQTLTVTYTVAPTATFFGLN